MGMRRSLLMLGLLLLAAAALAPALESLAPCVDESREGQCAADQCCSCCVHARSVKPDPAAPVDPLALSSDLAAGASARRLVSDPRDILHVPKTASA
jgi:hypothetical protein